MSWISEDELISADGSGDRPGFMMMPWLNLDDANGGWCPLELQKSKNGQRLEKIN